MGQGRVDRAFVEQARAGLAAASDPQRAPQMQRYMKSAMPYAGVTVPQVRRLVGGLVRASEPLSRADWEATVRALYDEAAVREERYVALKLAEHGRYRVYRDAAALPLWRHLIVTGAWWDLVDDASHLVGHSLAAAPDAVRPVVWAWAQDDDLWIRRVSIICQLAFKDATDLDLLTHALDANVEGTRYGSEFFVRKAIGWALRQYARTDPDWVRAFVAERSQVLSGLSRREALKHL